MIMIMIIYISIFKYINEKIAFYIANNYTK